MDANIDFSLLQKRLEEQERKNNLLEAEIERMSSKSGDGGGGPSDLLDWRVTEIEKRFDRFEMKLDGIRDDLVNVRLSMASLSTKDTVRGWGIGVIAAVLATGLTVGGLLLQSSSNQLAAFQAGLSAVATVASDQRAKP